MVFCVVSRVVCAMEFSLDNPGFSAYAELAPEALQGSSAPLPSTASGSSSSVPSSGDSTRRSCPTCRRWMSIILYVLLL